MAEAAGGAESLAQGAEKAGDGEAGCRRGGMVPRNGAGLPMGDESGATESDGGRKEGVRKVKSQLWLG